MKKIQEFFTGPLFYKLLHTNLIQHKSSQVPTNLFLQWHFTKLNFFKSHFDMHTLQFQKKCTLLYWPQESIFTNSRCNCLYWAWFNFSVCVIVGKILKTQECWWKVYIVHVLVFVLVFLPKCSALMVAHLNGLLTPPAPKCPLDIN